MSEIENQIYDWYKCKSTKFYFLLNIVYITIFGLSTFSYIKKVANELLMEAGQGSDAIDYAIPPEWLTDYFPYITVFVTILFLILGIFIASFIIKVMLNFLNQNKSFNQCLKIVSFSQLPFAIQGLILAIFNFMLELNLTSIISSKYKLLELVNPFFILQLFLLYVLFKKETYLKKNELLIMVIIFIVYKGVGLI